MFVVLNFPQILTSRLIVGKCCDEGKSFLSEVADSPATQAYKEIMSSKAETDVFYYLKKMKNSVQSETLKKSYAEVH
jgi:hypothetical protein